MMSIKKTYAYNTIFWPTCFKHTPWVSVTLNFHTVLIWILFELCYWLWARCGLNSGLLLVLMFYSGLTTINCMYCDFIMSVCSIIKSLTTWCFFFFWNVMLARFVTCIDQRSDEYKRRYYQLSQQMPPINAYSIDDDVKSTFNIISLQRWQCYYAIICKTCRIGPTVHQSDALWDLWDEYIR